MFADRALEKLSSNDKQLVERLKQTYPPEVLNELFSDLSFSAYSRKHSLSQRSSRHSRARSSARTSLSSQGWLDISSHRPFSHTTTISSRTSYGSEDEGSDLHKETDEQPLHNMDPQNDVHQSENLVKQDHPIANVGHLEADANNVTLEDSSVAYLCTVCGDLFTDAENWKQHESRSHERQFHWPCPADSCGYICITEEEFEQHYRLSHAALNRIHASSAIRPIPPQKVWGCGFETCEAVFYSFDDRCDHVAWHYETFASGVENASELRHWSYSTMLRNLLRQPATDMPFCDLMRLCYGPNQAQWPRLKWRIGNSADIRRRLEQSDFSNGVHSLIEQAHHAGRTDHVAAFAAMAARKMAALPSPPPEEYLITVHGLLQQNNGSPVPSLSFSPPLQPRSPMGKKLGLAILPPSPRSFQRQNMLTPPFNSVAPSSPTRHQYTVSDTAALSSFGVIHSSTSNLEVPMSPMSPTSPTTFNFSTFIEKFPTPPIPAPLASLPEIQRPLRMPPRREESSPRPRTADGTVQRPAPLKQALQVQDASPAPPSSPAFRPPTELQHVVVDAAIAPVSRPKTPISPRSIMDRAKELVGRDSSASTITLNAFPKPGRSRQSSVSTSTNTSPNSSHVSKRQFHRSRPPVLRLAPRIDPAPEMKSQPTPPVLPPINISHTPILGSMSRSASISSFAPLEKPTLVATSPAMPESQSEASQPFPLLRPSTGSRPSTAVDSRPSTANATSRTTPRHCPIFEFNPNNMPPSVPSSANTSPRRARYQPITIPYIPSRNSSLVKKARDEALPRHVVKARSARFLSDTGIEGGSTSNGARRPLLPRKMSASSVLASKTKTHQFELSSEPLSTIIASPMQSSFTDSYATKPLGQDLPPSPLSQRSFNLVRPATAGAGHLRNKRSGGLDWSASATITSLRPADGDNFDGIDAFLDQDPIERAMRKKARESGMFMTLAEFLSEVPPPRAS